MAERTNFVQAVEHCSRNMVLTLMWLAGNPRVTPEVTRDVCLLAANLYYAQIDDLMFEVKRKGSSIQRNTVLMF